jgi:two-component system cell cycle sensor histidine kinase/response regulator CckA
VAGIDPLLAAGQLEGVLETIPDPFVALDSSFSLVAANEPARGLGLVSRAGSGREMLGLAIVMSDLRRYATRSIETGAPVRFDWLHPGQGSLFDVLVSAKHGLVSVHFRDVSTDRRAQTELERSERRYRELAENSFDVIALVRWDWTLVDLNHRWEELSGYPSEELLGTQAFERLLTPSSREVLSAAIEQADETSSLIVAHDIQLETRSGELRTLEIGCRTVRESGRRTLIQLVGRDVTEGRQLADRLQQAQKLEAVGRLAGGVAHDLNTVLLVIRSACTLLRGQLTEPKDIELVDEVGHESERATSLVRQLLAFARRQVIQPTIVDPNEVVNDLRHMLERLVGGAIEVDVRLGTSLNVRGDRSQIEQVLVNLVVNASDAIAGAGTITIETSTRRFDEGEHPEWGDSAPADYVALDVRDTGIGIPPELRSRIFEPFFSLRGDENAGLGLSTVYGIVTQMGGGIDLESEPGQGSRFTIYLPGVLESATPPDAKSRGPQGTEQVGKGANVLLVEDEPSAQRMLERLLVSLGYRVVVASDAASALELLDGSERVDVLLTDVVMPTMSGVELAERLRDRAPEIPIIYMSGYSETAVTVKGRLSRGEALLEKPFSAADLAAAIAEVLTPKSGGT